MPIERGVRLREVPVQDTCKINYTVLAFSLILYQYRKSKRILLPNQFLYIISSNISRDASPQLGVGNLQILGALWHQTVGWQEKSPPPTMTHTLEQVLSEAAGSQRTYLPRQEPSNSYDAYSPSLTWCMLRQVGKVWGYPLPAFPPRWVAWEVKGKRETMLKGFVFPPWVAPPRCKVGAQEGKEFKYVFSSFPSPVISMRSHLHMTREKSCKYLDFPPWFAP